VVIFLILESLGSTELAFILLMALIFFGPRKLPQLSRSLGKNLASFRKASEDFKRTWEKEVDLEEFNLTRIEQESTERNGNSILNNEEPAPAAPTINAVDTDLVVPRESKTSEAPPNSVAPSPAEPPSKRDWL
jgi:TatA/E family protein of Tat protein translocase